MGQGYTEGQLEEASQDGTAEQFAEGTVIYATNKEWLGTLYQPDPGEVYIMSEDGVFCATCFVGSLRDGNGVPLPVPEGLEHIQHEYCVVKP